MRTFKKFAVVFVLVLVFALVVFVGCKDKENNENKDPQPGPQQEREVYTYIDEDFADLEIGDSLEAETDIFEYYEGGGFIVSTKDDYGTWIQAKDKNGGSNWALAYTNIYKDRVKVALKNFCLSFDTRLPGDEVTRVNPDGGCCILWSPDAGRYDLAINTSADTNGATGNSINLWHAMDTEGGPFATTQHDATWGERGSVVNEYSLTDDVIYTITVCGKHQGIDEDGNEFFTLYVFVNDTLVIYERDVTYWDGGFGLRGYISPYEYTNFKVTDFPKVCPDGIDHWTVDNASSVYTVRSYAKIGTPVVTTSEKTISWEAIEGAAGYNIYSEEQFIAFVNTTSYDFSNLYTDETTLYVQAMPAVFGKNGSEKGSIVVSNPATQVETPVLSLSGKRITWDAIENAVNYEIYVNDELYTIQASTTFYASFETNGEYIIEVKAIVEDPAYKDSEKSESVTFVKEGGLNLTAIALEEGVVTWTGDTRATGYQVYLNGELTTTVTECSYTLPDTNDYCIVVIAVDSTEAVASSEPATIYTGETTTLPAPVLSYSAGSTFSWAAVAGATKYAIYRNGVFAMDTTELSYTYADKAVYTVKAIGNKALILDSAASVQFITMDEAVPSPAQLDNTATQNAGDVADFGWNEYGARFTVLEKDLQGNVWFGLSEAPDTFKETWFWAKADAEGTVTYDNWTLSADVRFISSTGGNFQILFGTASNGGRYASCYWPNGGMNLYRAGEIQGAYCEALTGTAPIHIQINHATIGTKGYVTIYVNGTRYIATEVPDKCIGDYGLWLEAGVNAQFANVKVSSLKNGPDGQYTGAPIQLIAPVVTRTGKTLNWTDEQDYVLGYDVYLDGSVVAKLASNVYTYSFTDEGVYSVKAVGNGTSILTSGDSNDPSLVANLENLVKNQEIGENAAFDWNTLMGNPLKITAKEEGKTWFGSDGTAFAETWFPGTTEKDWTWTVNVRYTSGTGNIQCLFGTSTPNGRYSFIMWGNGGYQLYRNGALVGGATDAIVRNDTAIVINSHVQLDGSTVITVTVNGTEIISQPTIAAEAAYGDFGFMVEANVVASFSGSVVYLG